MAAARHAAIELSERGTEIGPHMSRSTMQLLKGSWYKAVVVTAWNDTVFPLAEGLMLVWRSTI